MTDFEPVTFEELCRTCEAEFAPAQDDGPTMAELSHALDRLALRPGDQDSRGQAEVLLLAFVFDAGITRSFNRAVDAGQPAEHRPAASLPTSLATHLTGHVESAGRDRWRLVVNLPPAAGDVRRRYPRTTKLIRAAGKRAAKIALRDWISELERTS